MRRDDERNEVEMLMPVMAEVFGNIGITKDDVDFICSGSTDYLIGGPFSFVMALDAVGVWPPRSESHVEMDGAWALYEAWVLLQEGEIDAALVYSFGRSSLGNLGEILALQLDPYYLAPLWPDPVSLAALQARALIDAGKATEAEFAAIAARSRTGRPGQPQGPGGQRRSRPRRLLEDEYVVSPAASPRASPRSPTGRPPSCWPPGTRPGSGGTSRCGSPASTTGWRPTPSGPGTSPPRRPRPRPPRWPAWPTARSTWPRSTPPSPIRRSSCAEALGLDDTRDHQPVGWAAGRQPGHVGRPHPDRRGGRTDPFGGGRPGGGPRHLGTLPATESRLRPGRCVMAERCAVIGVGQTHHKAKRDDVSIAGLVREAAKAALADADLTWSDIDAVVIGKAPDMFEGNMMPEIYLAPALGAVGKPMFRVHTAGSVGWVDRPGGRPPGQVGHPPAGPDGGLREAVRLRRHVGPVGSPALRRPPAGRGRRATSPRTSGPTCAVPGAPDHIGRMVAVKDRQNAMRNPYAHLHLADIDMKMVEESMMLWEPLRYLESCPSSDGAAAMVLAAEDAPSRATTRRRGSTGRPCAPSRPCSPAATRSIPRPGGTARPTSTRRPGSPTRGSSSTAPRSTCRSAGTSRCGWRTWASATSGDGWKLTESGATAFDGDIPWNASGGVLSSNPIGASGMLRFLEVAMQVRGQAGEHQVDGARLALGQAYGGGSQFFAMWVVGSDKP